MRERFRDTVLTMLGSFIPTANASRLRVGLQLSCPWLAITWARSGCFAHSLRVPDSRVQLCGASWHDVTKLNGWPFVCLMIPPAQPKRFPLACVHPRRAVKLSGQLGREAGRRRRREGGGINQPKAQSERASRSCLLSCVRIGF